jgi:hypothetical protein
LYPELYRLVRDVRDAPGRINRYEGNPAVADDAIEAGYLDADVQGWLKVTPAGEKAFHAQSE